MLQRTSTMITAPPRGPCKPNSRAHNSGLAVPSWGVSHLVPVLRVLALAALIPAAAHSSPRSESIPTPPPAARIIHAGALQADGLRGQGVRVGVIAPGAQDLPVLTGAGILPAKITSLGTRSGTGSQGSRMLQVVHQIAPQAQLGFCAASTGAQAVRCASALVTRFHAQIIVDDINPLPVLFWPGAKALGYSRLHVRFPDVLFFTGAGQSGGGYYQGRYIPTRLLVGGHRYSAQNFGRSLGQHNNPYNTFTLPAGATAKIALGWNDDPSHNPSTNACAPANNEISLILLTARGNVAASDQGPCPLEQISYTNHQKTAQRLRIAILINAPTDTSQLTFKVLAVNPGNSAPWRLRYATAGAAGIAATVPQVLAVGAVDPYTGFRNRYLLETSASAGPQCQEFVRTGVGKNERRLTRPRCWQQPALVAPDRARVAVATPAAPGYRRADTSGDPTAASVAAGAAALLLSAKIDPTRIPGLLMETAVAQTSRPGWDSRYGWGLIDLRAAAARAGVLKAPLAGKSNGASGKGLPTERAYVHWKALARKADRGDKRALSALVEGAQRSHAAQTWLAIHYAHSAQPRQAAYWYRQAAEGGASLAQLRLGDLFAQGAVLPKDARAAFAWWRRAARAGLPTGLYRLGIAYIRGYGTPAETHFGYALLLAAKARGYRHGDVVVARLGHRFQRQERRRANVLAHRWSRDPSAIP